MHLFYIQFIAYGTAAEIFEDIEKLKDYCDLFGRLLDLVVLFGLREETTFGFSILHIL